MVGSEDNPQTSDKLIIRNNYSLSHLSSYYSTYIFESDGLATIDSPQPEARVPMASHKIATRRLLALKNRLSGASMNIVVK